VAVSAVKRSVWAVVLPDQKHQLVFGAAATVSYHKPVTRRHSQHAHCSCRAGRGVPALLLPQHCLQLWCFPATQFWDTVCTVPVGAGCLPPIPMMQCGTVRRGPHSRNSARASGDRSAAEGRLNTTHTHTHTHTRTRTHTHAHTHTHTHTQCGVADTEYGTFNCAFLTLTLYFCSRTDVRPRSSLQLL
jgi:hypothetical protein